MVADGKGEDLFACGCNLGHKLQPTILDRILGGDLEEERTGPLGKMPFGRMGGGLGLKGGAVDEADAKLRAAMKYITAHRSLRYCKMIMLTQGPATSAALCAMGDEPKLFEYRVRAISACQPTPLKALSVVGRRGGGVPLEARVNQLATSVPLPCHLRAAGRAGDLVAAASDADVNGDEGCGRLRVGVRCLPFIKGMLRAQVVSVGPLECVGGAGGCV